MLGEGRGLRHAHVGLRRGSDRLPPSDAPDAMMGRDTNVLSLRARSCAVSLGGLTVSAGVRAPRAQGKAGARRLALASGSGTRTGGGLLLDGADLPLERTSSLYRAALCSMSKREVATRLG